jgi:hypothetical protein
MIVKNVTNYVCTINVSIFMIKVEKHVRKRV